MQVLHHGNYAFPNTIQNKFIFFSCSQKQLRFALVMFTPSPSLLLCFCFWAGGFRRLLPRAGVVFLVMFLRDAVGHVGSDGAHLGRALHVKHLIVKVDVRPDLLQHGALGRPRQEQGLVDLQAPGPERLQRTDPRAGRAASRDQVRPDGTVQALAFGVKLLLELPQGLQEALQGTLPQMKEEIQTK